MATRNTMDVAVGARVHCTDGDAGVCDAVIVSPDDGAITFLVVRERRDRGRRRLVPIALVESAEPEEIRLKCTTAELEDLDAFDQTERLGPRFEERIEALPGAYGLAILEPMRYSVQPTLIHDELIPEGEAEIDRHAEVDATDGRVGHVQGFLIDDEDRMTHVVVRSGTLPRREYVVPATAIARIEDERVKLDLDRHALRALPHAYDDGSEASAT
jgi:hypothetical protein